VERTEVTEVVPISGDPLAEKIGHESCFVVVYGPGLGRKHALQLEPGQELAVGRGSDCGICVPLKDVSRRHFHVVSRSGELRLRDGGSTNGTQLNGVDLLPGQEAPLRCGDLVKAGGVIFKFLSSGNVESLYFEEIYRTTIVDGLTGAHNQRYLMEYLEREMARCRRHGRPLSLLLFDIDHFKQVNDQYGHVAGDHVLREVAESVREIVRKEECFARYGGEEFAVAMPETDLERARIFAEKIRNRVAARNFSFEGQPVRITVSVGLAAFDPEHKEVAQFVRAADSYLYAAKNAGRNCVAG
jgi:diguanylate cyclase (GGDEF)-like protein